jgi:hypothetical protein
MVVMPGQIFGQLEVAVFVGRDDAPTTPACSSSARFR